MQEACVKSDTATPIKPERKSRVTSVELKKTKADENQREEATSLLKSRSEPTERKVLEQTSEANSINLENRFFTLDLHREMPSSAKKFDPKDLPSSSVCDRNSTTILQSDDQGEISLKDTEIVLRRMKKEKINESEEKTKNEKRTNKTSSILKNMLESLMLRKYGVVMICQWWTSAMACGILDDLMPNFPINRHVTFALGGILEIATYTFVYFMVSKYGRRLSMCMYQSFNGVVCILIAIFLILTTTVAPWADLAKTVTLLFGKVTVTSTISIVYLYTIETFPTVIRASCLGLCVVFAKLGSLSTPYSLLLV